MSIVHSIDIDIYVYHLLIPTKPVCLIMTKLLLTNAFNVYIPTLGLPCMYVFLWVHSSGTYTAPISMFFYRYWWLRNGNWCSRFKVMRDKPHLFAFYKIKIKILFKTIARLWLPAGILWFIIFLKIMFSHLFWFAITFFKLGTYAKR